MYNRNKDFADLIDKIDSHVFTGDTLCNETNLERLRIHLGRWERAVKSMDESNAESAQELAKNGEEADPVYYYAVTTSEGNDVYFESEREFTNLYAVTMQCKALELFGSFGALVEAVSFKTITKEEYWEHIF